MYAATVHLVPLLTSEGTGDTLAATALGLLGVGQVTVALPATLPGFLVAFLAAAVLIFSAPLVVAIAVAPTGGALVAA